MIVRLGASGVLLNTLRCSSEPSCATTIGNRLVAGIPVALREYIPESRPLVTLDMGTPGFVTPRRGSLHRAFVHYRLSACGIGDFEKHRIS